MPRTELPSVAISYGELPYTQQGFDFTRDGGSAELLALDPATYDRVLLFPGGLAAPGLRFHEFERFERMTQNAAYFATLFSLITLLERLNERGKMPVVYLPGFFSTNSPAWRRLMHPVMYTRGMTNFQNRLDQVFQWFRRSASAWWCEFAWDGSGGPKNLTDVDVLAIAYADTQGVVNHTEGHPASGSPLQSYRSITTAWAALESQSGELAPPARRAIFISNNSGIGHPDGCFLSNPIQHIGSLGRDHRHNYVPDWRDQGRAIYIPVWDIRPDGTCPPYWYATSRDTIYPDPPNPQTP